MKTDHPPIQPGDIIFTSKKGPLSWTLRFFFGPFAYSHLCIGGPAVDGQPTVYTTGIGGGPGINQPKRFSLGPTTRYRQLYASTYLANKRFVICRYSADGRAGLSDKQVETIMNWCRSQLGRKFPFRKTGKYFRQTFRGHGIDQIKVPGQEHLYTCYEAVVVAYAKAGIDLNPRAGNIDASGYDIKEIYLSPYLTNVYKS